MSYRSKIKICGIKTPKEAREVASLDVDFLGAIFAKSKRQVSAQTAREIAGIAHAAGKKCVGVFAGQSDCEIMEICEFAALDVAQIHGEVSVLDALPAVDIALCDMPLFDCKGENAGGNGISFDWEILRAVKFDFGMAGGIGEHNAREAIKFNPRVLDLNSKVEDENGVKNITKILNILEIIR